MVQTKIEVTRAVLDFPNLGSLKMQILEYYSYVFNGVQRGNSIHKLISRQ